MSFPKFYFKILILLCISVLALMAVLYNFKAQPHITAINCKHSAEEEVTGFEKYLIRTPNCAIERVPLFTPDTAHMFRRYQSREYDCPPDDGSAGIKRVNATWVQVPVKNCLAREVERDASTEGGQYGKTFYFGNRTVMNFPTSDAVIVACRNFQLQRIIPLIPYRKPLYLNESAQKSLNHKTNRPNILAIGVDSISRLNFLRHFTETKKFIDEKHFEGPLFGLHKVGDNTWPNLMAMFTGLDLERVEKTIPDSRKLDDVPLIFKEFSAAGYINTYIENMPNFGLWTYHWKNGFINKPYDYWMRPVNILVFKEMKRYYCYKEKLEMELYFDYLIDQMLAFRQRDQRFLSFVHMAAVTHDFLNYAQYADLPVLRFLKRIYEHHLNSNTVIIFYSDHGLRMGPVMVTESGYHESRLPFMYFSIPSSLQLKDDNGAVIGETQIRQTLRLNARRLTSQFDVHATLKHLLMEQPPLTTAAEPYGRSLFTAIPLNRTCKQAGIPDEFCLCHPFTELTNGASILTLANFMIDQLNQKLQKYTDKCVLLKLGAVLKAKIAADLTNDVKPKMRQFLLRITTLPNGGTVEMAFRALADASGQLVDEAKTAKAVSGVLRLDQYWQQSLCVANTAVENICYCKDLIK